MAVSRKVACPAYLFFNGETYKTSTVRGINPVYKTTSAACADVSLPEQVVIQPHTCAKVDLYVGFDIPKGYKILMYPRSSLLVKYGILQPVSVIDYDYSCQHVHVPLYNITDKPVTFEKGMRVAQIECVPVYDCPDWNHEDTKRDSNNGGFGSTGV